MTYLKSHRRLHSWMDFRPKLSMSRTRFSFRIKNCLDQGVLPLTSLMLFSLSTPWDLLTVERFFHPQDYYSETKRRRTWIGPLLAVILLMRNIRKRMCQSLSKRTVLHVTHNGLDLLLSLQEQLLRFVIKNFLVDHNGLHTSLKSSHHCLRQHKRSKILPFIAFFWVELKFNLQIAWRP